MKALTKLITATVAAASIASFAAPALAAHTIGSNTYSGEGPDSTWIENGGVGALAGGTLTGFASGLVDEFNFSSSTAMAGATGIAALLNLSATTSA